MAGKTKSQKKRPLDMRSKMYLVLALCSVMLLVSIGMALALIGGMDLGGADAQSVSTVDSASMVVGAAIIKRKTPSIPRRTPRRSLSRPPTRAKAHVDETLFLGDSNTARMYRMFDYCSYDNAIGSVGMTAKQPGDLCLRAGKHFIRLHHDAPGRGKIAARRVILTFGTNDLNPGYKAADFVKTTRLASRPSSPPTPAWTSSSTPSRPSGSSTPTRA